MTVYQAKITTLTPLHIGDGNELRQDFDFTVFENRTYRLDENRILSEKLDLRARNYPLPGKLLAPTDYANPAYFRYVLPGAPRSARVDARIKSCIKDIYDCPYLPGSSIKGALRTALAWTGWTSVKPELNRSAIGRSRSWAGQPLEHKIFGPDPNHDLLRALHVADFQPSSRTAGQGLIVLNAQVLTLKSSGSPVELEALKGEQVFEGSLTVDDTLFSALAERELHFASRRGWLDELVASTGKHSLARIRQLAEWYEKAQGCERVADFYRRLAEISPAANKAVLQIGWGAGWDGKTFWTHLQTDPRLFEQLVYDFRMHKAPPGAPPRRPGDPFPRSRRAVMAVKGGVARAIAPLGWVLLEVEKVR